MDTKPKTSDGPTESSKAPAEPLKAEAEPAKTEITGGGGYEPGFRSDKSAYPGVDPDTGERKAVTWAGLREEFGEREGARLYNDLAVAAFGGVQPGKPSLSYITAIDEKYFRSRQKDSEGRFTESEEDYAKARKKFLDRGDRAKKLMTEAETKKKGV